MLFVFVVLLLLDGGTDLSIPGTVYGIAAILFLIEFAWRFLLEFYKQAKQG